MTKNGPKIDPELAFELSTRDDNERLGVLVRLSNPLDQEQREALKNAGVEVGSEAGNIISCRASVQAIRRLSQLDFVVSIEGGRVRPY